MRDILDQRVITDGLWRKYTKPENIIRQFVLYFCIKWSFCRGCGVILCGYKNHAIMHNRRYSIIAKMIVLLSAASMAMNSAPVQAEDFAGAFVRQADKPEVMWQYAPDLYCHVQNETQMALFGGFGKVKVVPKMAMAGRSTGDCGWPNGFYRRDNETPVFKLSGVGLVPAIGPNICHVVNETQMALFGGFGKVQPVPPTSDIARGRGGMTECANP
ncbi:hypothetical protein GTZ99_05880 [Novosphingobium sp. FSY-8]|uniref:Uncharacterized protein n=1 Tax=Novosphingobium ovatum TaxID=1908523 RepID=A0ABW9XC30_9SPHN|nr:hypothetical protein [Novosphingobium ovatum]NBC36085.1 hypothetical protein [Novosphingobium ovatum]